MDEVSEADTPSRPRRRRTWPQRLVLVFNIVLVVGCLVGAVAIFAGQKNAEDTQRENITLSQEQEKPTPSMVVESLPSDETTTTAVEETTTTTEAPDFGTTSTTIDPLLLGAPPDSQNFLLTGSDSRDCIDPDSPYAGAFLSGATGGSRPDTIMVMRVEPSTGRAAFLSFPRDLWVPVAGSSRKAKINSTLDKTDATPLIATIESYFKIPIDHYVNIDFCVFKDLVDAVGGVTVPFVTPVRDKNTGLLVEDSGCYTFNGDHALAYVRSRKIQYQDKKGLWHSEGTADIGRIRRQQDFLRRVMQEVRSKGVLDLGFMKTLLDSFQRRVIVDADLTARDLLRMANAMKGMDPTTTRNFIVEGKFSQRGNAFVIEPTLTTDSMEAILALFRGDAPLAQAPEEQDDPIAADPIGPPTSAATPTPPGATTTTTSDAETTTTEPAPDDDNIDRAYGGGHTVVPDKFAVCP